MSSKDLTPKHVDLYDSTLRAIIEGALNQELVKTRRVTGLVRLNEGTWIVRLEFDPMKDMRDTSTPSPQCGWYGKPAEEQLQHVLTVFEGCHDFIEGTEMQEAIAKLAELIRLRKGGTTT